VLHQFSFVALCICAAGLAGCAASLDNEKTLQSMSAQGKGGVLMEVGMTGVPCYGGSVVVAKAEGDHYRSAGTIAPVGAAVTGPWWGELDPGEYHIVHIKCITGAQTSVLGETFFTPYKKSFGRFEVRANEIVSIGSLELIKVGFKTVDLAARTIPDADLEIFRKNYPNLAARTAARLLELPFPALTGRDLERYCATSTSRNHVFAAPAHPKCVALYEESARRLKELDPGRPALSH
jgi:hypothetical protein